MPSLRSITLLILSVIALFAVAVLFKSSQQERAYLEHPYNRVQTAVPRVTEVPNVDSSFYEPVIARAVSSLPKVDTNSQQRPQQSFIVSPVNAVTADSYLVGDVRTGTIYLERNSSEVLPVASMSKLVTAIAAINLYAPTTSVVITEEETNVPPDTSGLITGERFTRSELLYPLLMNSSNVAAEALASSTDRIRFLQNLPSYSLEIGMPQTYFADPSGLSPSNRSTAKDFFALARYLFGYRQDVLAITRTASSSVATTTDHGFHIFSSIHPFVRDPRFLGGKTGHTDAALDTMLTIMNINGKPIAFIVLHSQNRALDTSLLINEYLANQTN